MYKIALAAITFVLAAAVHAGEATTVVVTDPWVRALPPTQSNTAAYMIIANDGDSAVEIVGATSELAPRVEIHTTREVDGYQRMERLDTLALPPGARLELAPGGTHLMLLGLERMPIVGEQAEICLQLAAGDEICATAAVRKDAAGASHDHHNHNH